MAEYSRLASGMVTSTGGNTVVVLPFIPDYIAIENSTRLIAGTGVSSASWMTDMGQGSAVLSTLAGTGSQYIGPTTALTSAGLTPLTGFSTFSAGIALQYGPVYQHMVATPTTLDFSISKASPAVVTTTTAHGLVSGNVVVFSNLAQTSTTGMQQIAGIPFTITYSSPTAFTINWNTNQSNYTAFNTATSTNNVGSFKQILYPALYAPGIAFIDAITTTTNTVTTTSAHNFQVGQEIAFRVPSIWGSTQLNALPNILIPGSPNYYYVATVPSSTTFTTVQSLSAVTAFNSNQPYASYPGQKFAEVVAVGDANTGYGLNTMGPLSPSPTVFNGLSTSAVSTINGPTIAGAYFNATYMGFIIGSGVAGTLADVIYWRAYLHDLNT